jgi:hypothetical protein
MQVGFALKKLQIWFDAIHFEQFNSENSEVAQYQIKAQKSKEL